MKRLVAIGCSTALLAACAQKRAPSKASAPSAASAVAGPSATAPSAETPVIDSEAAQREPATPPELVHVDGPSLLDLIRANGGHGTIVNIWASWCGPCRRELPMFRSLADNLRGRGLSIVLVSVDEPESEPELSRMLTAEGFSHPFYVASRPLGPFKQALHPGWPGVIPATFLFDETGRRRYFWGGPVYENELLPIAEGLVLGQKIDGEARFDLAPGQESGH